MTVQHEILINTKPTTLYTYLFDVEHRSDFVPNLEEVRLLGEAPIREGSRYREVTTMMGKRVESIYRVTQLIPNQLIASETEKSIFPIQAVLSLEPIGDDTKLSLQLDFQLKGIYKLGSGVVYGAVDLQVKTLLDNVRRVFEVG